MAGGDAPVSAEELHELEQQNADVRRSAERLAQLEAERALVEEMADENFEGPSWQRYAEELAAYGRAVIFAWLVTGEMFPRATKRGRGVGEKPPHFTRDDCDEVTQEVVIRGLRHFQRRALRARLWDPAKGAAMKTYFIGGCVGEFSNAFDYWRGESNVPTDPGDLDLRGHLDNPEDQLIYAESITSVIESLSPTNQAIISLYGAGYRQEEIAQLLGLHGAEAVAERVRRILRRIQKDREDDEAVREPDMADLDRINELIEQSSLGTPEARDLRRRTSRAEARRLVTAAERRDAVELQREPAHQERRAPLRDRGLGPRPAPASHRNGG